MKISVLGEEKILSVEEMDSQYGKAIETFFESTSKIALNLIASMQKECLAQHKPFLPPLAKHSLPLGSVPYRFRLETAQGDFEKLLQPYGIGCALKTEVTRDNCQRVSLEIWRK